MRSNPCWSGTNFLFKIILEIIIIIIIITGGNNSSSSICSSFLGNT